MIRAEVSFFQRSSRNNSRGQVTSRPSGTLCLKSQLSTCAPGRRTCAPPGPYLVQSGHSNHRGHILDGGTLSRTSRLVRHRQTSDYGYPGHCLAGSSAQPAAPPVQRDSDTTSKILSAKRKPWASENAWPQKQREVTGKPGKPHTNGRMFTRQICFA